MVNTTLSLEKGGGMDTASNCGMRICEDDSDDSDAGASHKPNSLKWDEGMQDIVAALAAYQGRLMIDVAAEHGLPWDNGMKDVIDLTTQEELVEKDVATDLYSFMLAAIGKRRSLHLMYDLAKRCPQNIKRF